MNKSELKAIFINAKATDAKYIGVSIQTEDSSQPEIIINPNANFDAKFDYYMEAYDDDLILIAAKGKKDIRITAAGQGNRFEDIECQLLGERGKERSYYRYEDGKRVKHTVTPVLGEKAAHNGKVVYSLDFEVTPHQLRHTYITNLIHASIDPKTVQYLAGHESSKITMDIYAKVKYNRPDELVRSMSCAFASWDAAQ